MPPPHSTPKRPRVQPEPSPLKPRSLQSDFEAGSSDLVAVWGWGGIHVLSSVSRCLSSSYRRQIPPIASDIVHIYIYIYIYIYKNMNI